MHCIKNIAKIECIISPKQIERNIYLIGRRLAFLIKFYIKSKNNFNRVTKYAEEQVAYGLNYFMKVSIGDDFYIHIRVHRRQDCDVYDFYSLHETFRGDVATCIFTEGKYQK